MTKTKWVYLTLVGVGAVALLAWAFAPRPIEVEVAVVSQGRFETSVDEDGKTRLHDRYVVSAPLAGRLARIELREGDAVAAGTVVATLTPLLAPMQDERTLRELQARVEGAQANVLLVDARVARARVGVEQARTEMRRTEQLAKQGFVAPTKLDGDRLATLAAEKELEAAQQQQHIAGHELEQARAASGAVRQTGANAGRSFAVQAPVSGRVLRVAQTSEAMVAPGTPLVEIGDTASLEVVAELLTTDALQTPPGSRVIVERWGGPGVLSGVVRRVEPAAFTKVSALGVEEQRVRVLIDITTPPPQWQALGDGYRVGVRIVTLSQAQAVQVPVSAVFPLPAGANASANGAVRDPAKEAPAADAGADSAAAARMAVFAVEGGRARVVPVELGARNGVDAWLRSGLKPGATVIVYPAREVRDGVRVKQRSV